MEIRVFTPFKDENWTWLESWFDTSQYHFHFHKSDLLKVSYRKFWVWLLATYRFIKNIKSDYEIIITHGPWLTFYMSLMVHFFKKPNLFIAHTFNHGNKRFFKGIYLKLAKKITVNKVDLFVTFSEYERNLYSSLYSIPLENIAFTHWAVDYPRISKKHPSYMNANEKYICSMGRNNRDYQLLIDAVSKLPVKLIIVTTEEIFKSFSKIPQNVIIKYNIPLQECIDILNYSILNIVPLKDVSTGAGHMTIVNAMLCGKPQIITKIDTVTDYFIPNKHGIFVEQDSIQDMQNAINTIISNDKLMHTFSIEAKNFADKWLNENAAFISLKNILDNISNNKLKTLVPPDWKS